MKNFEDSRIEFYENPSSWGRYFPWGRTNRCDDGKSSFEILYCEWCL